MKSALLAFLLLNTAPAVRPPQAEPPTASINGLIVKLGTGEPIPRAQVVLSPVQDEKANSITATTDQNGRFSFPVLPSNRYRMVVSRDGYVRAEYGQRTPYSPGTAITLNAGQRMADVVVRLTPTGAISGRIFDRYGEPVANALVELWTFKYENGQRVLRPVKDASTNDLGEYRIYWLQPDQYVVSAIPPQEGPSSPVVSEAGNARGVGRSRLAITTDSEGTFRSPEAYVPVYFPGTTDSGQAAPIDLPPGANFTGVDLTVVAAQAVRIRGRLLNGITGQPQGASVTLIGPKGTVGTAPPQQTTMAKADGTFELRGIVPGSYDVIATSAYTVQVSDASLRQSTTRILGRAAVEVGSADIDSLLLVLQRGFNLTGRVAIEGRPPGIENKDLAGMRIQIRRESNMPQLSPQPATVAPDGTFTLNNVAAGDYRLTVISPNILGYTKVARLGGSDVLDSGLRLDAPPLEQLEILISPNPGAVTAVVLNDKQEPVQNATVALIVNAPRRERLDLYRSATTDQSGRARFDAVAPGDYKAFAWESIEEGAWQNPYFIRAYENRGEPVHIDEGSGENLELRVVPSQ